MRWLALILSIPLISCTAGRGASALHDPDLRLAELAENPQGSSELFTSYRIDGPVRWNQGWPWKLDLSGVAWDKPNTATVLTPRHVVMAAHFIRKAGSRIVFHDRAGRPHSRIVQQVVKLTDRGVPCDVAVGLLDEPLPESIRRYPLPAAREDDGAALIGATALVTEQKRRLFFHRIADIRDKRLRMRFDQAVPESRRKNLIVGDSGHPSFIISHGELLLVETHTGGGPGSGPYYGSAVIQDGIRKVMRELDPAFTFRTIELDGPTLKDAEAGRASFPTAPKPATETRPKVVPPTTTPTPGTSPGGPRRPRPRVVRPAGS